MKEVLQQAIDFAEYCLEELDLSYMASNQAKRLIEKSRQAIAEAESKRAVLDAIIKSSEKRNEEWDALSADEQAAYHAQNACPYCGGSGHKDDIAEAEKQEPVAWQATQEKCRIEIVPAQGGLLPTMQEGKDFTLIHPQPKREPLTIEQLREHWQVAKVLDMTDAEIDFADYVLIARDVEALYGIKGEA